MASNKDKVMNVLSSASSAEEKKEKIPEIYKMILSQTRDTRLMWLVCSAFERGIHHAVLDEDTDTLVSPRLPEGTKRSRINKIGAWSKQMLARIVAVRPDFEVVPRSLEMKDINSSQCGTAFLQQNALNQSWHIKRHQVIKYLLSFGNAFGYIRDYEDKTKLFPVPILDDEGQPVMDEETGGEKVVTVPVKDVTWEPILPHNVLCDTTPGEIDDKQEVIVAFWRNIEYFPMAYPGIGEKVMAESLGQSAANFDLSLLSHISRERAMMQGAMELFYMSKPREGDEDGVMAIYAGGVLLEDSKWKYKRMTSYPLVHFRMGPPSPGEFFTEPPPKDQIPIQKDINEVASIIQENISNMGHVKWGVPIGSGVSDINDLSGEMVSYIPGLRPEQIGIAPLPNYEVGHLATLDKLLEDVQQFHSVSKGSGTPNVRSAVGLDKLSEEDTTPLGIVDNYMGDTFQKLGSKILQIAAETLDTPRMVRYVGEGRRRTIPDFNKEMLEGFGDVNVRMVDSHMRSKGATQELILRMHENGMITDNVGRKDGNQARKLLQFALPESLYTRSDQQRQVQYDENEYIIRGENIPVNEWDYHWEHLDVVEEMLNSMEWKLLSRDDPELGKAGVRHREEHLGFIQRAIAPALEQGQPGGGEQPREA